MVKNFEAPWEEQASAPDYSALLDAGEWLIFFKSDGMYVLEDDGTEHGPISPGGSLAGEIFFGAASMWPSTTSGAEAPAKTEYGTNDVDLYEIAFDQTAEEYAQFNVWMPDGWDAGTITAKFVWTAAAGSGDIVWALQGRAYADDDAIDQAWGTPQTVTDTLLATGDIHYSPETSAITLAGTPAAGELVQFRVYRDADAGGDTLSGDASLVGVKIYFTKS